MTDVLAFIRKSISADVAARKVIDIDRYCRLLASIMPELTPYELQSKIIQIVASNNGNAVWGEHAHLSKTNRHGPSSNEGTNTL